MDLQDIITKQIFNESNNLSIIKDDWNSLLNYRKLLNKGLQQRSSFMLIIDQLVEIDRRYRYSLHLIKDYNNYSWYNNYYKILCEWLNENNKDIRMVLLLNNEYCESIFKKLNN
jgi:hypothetical protein